MGQEENRVVKKALNLFLVWFLAIGFILGGLVAVIYRNELKTFLDEIKNSEKYSLELQSKAIKAELDSVVSDVRFLSNQNELISFLESGDKSITQEILREYVHFSRASRAYDQIRLLDETGVEVVRVNYNNGEPKAVPQEKLQDKSKRYYFIDCFKLNDAEFFVSPLDLNIENGQIEQPLKPMIRVGTPLFDSQGNKRGIILLNYLAERMLNRVFDSAGNPYSEKMFLRSDGYWFMNPDKNKEWGFMFKSRTQDTIANEYPEEWQKILTMKQGQFQTDNGLFTFRTIYPLDESYRSSTGASEAHARSFSEVHPSQYFWVQLSHVPSAFMENHTHTLLLKLFLVGGGGFLLVAVGAWYIALAVTRRKLYQSQLLVLATHDFLTGLPNRRHFFDHLEEYIALAHRHGRKLALLYIDLDGFKYVNDTKGHLAGDELLIQVGKVLAGLIRKTDTLARLGGDEFAIILREIQNADDARVVGEKIVKTLSQPFELADGVVSIGASVGAAVYPDHETSIEGLIKAADDAMYAAKKRGKGSYATVG